MGLATPELINQHHKDDTILPWRRREFEVDALVRELLHRSSDKLSDIMRSCAASRSTDPQVCRSPDHAGLDRVHEACGGVLGSGWVGFLHTEATVAYRPAIWRCPSATWLDNVREDPCRRATGLVL